MKKTINNDGYEIIYEENFWTGKKHICINGQEAVKIKRNNYKTQEIESFTVLGNSFLGVKIVIGSKVIEVTPATKWYEWLLSTLPLFLVVIWGNSVELCKIVPIVGGAIGGGIAGALAVTNIYIIKKTKQVWLKLVISLAMLAATFALCYLTALIILSTI